MCAPLGQFALPRVRKLGRYLLAQPASDIGALFRRHGGQPPPALFDPLRLLSRKGHDPESTATCGGRSRPGRHRQTVEQRLDEAGDLGYLETDKAENVRLYERHGFEVVDEAPVLGVPNWFMRREPRAAAAG